MANQKEINSGRGLYSAMLFNILTRLDPSALYKGEK